MSRLRIALVAAVGAAALAGACLFPDPELEIDHSEYHLRYDADTDALRLVEIHHGVQSYTSHGAAGAADVVEKLVAGWRRFPPEGGWLFVMDMDREGFWNWEDEIAEGAAPEEAAALMSRMKAVDPRVRVERAGTFLKEDRRLAFYREVRVDGVTDLLGLINEYLNLELQYAEPDPERGVVPEFPIFDSRTVELWKQAGEVGHSWWRIEDEGLVLEVPMTPENAAACLTHMLTEIAKSSDPEEVALFQYLRRLEVQDERVRLDFRPEEDGWFHLIEEATGSEYDSSLVEELESRGHSFSEVPDLAGVRDLLMQ